MRCRCQACSPDDVGPTYTEAHRFACEVRDVAGLDDNPARAAYLKLVEKHRGANAAQRLRDAVWKQMRAIA